MPDTQPDTDLISLAEAKAECKIETADTKSDGDILSYIRIATDLIEDATERRIITRGSEAWVESHDLPVPQAFVYTIERPIRTFEWLKVEGSVVERSKLLVDSANGRVALIGAERKHPLVPGSFGGGFGPDFPEDANFRFGTSFAPLPIGLVEVKYVGGYASRTDLKPLFKRAARTLVAIQYREMSRKSQGLISESTAVGNETKYAKEIMPEDIAELLRPERTFSKTGVVALAP